MNALCGTVIKVFLTLMQADDTVREDDGDGADRRDGKRKVGRRGYHGIKNRKVSLILTAD